MSYMQYISRFFCKGICFSVILLATTPVPAHAYLDPGTGSMLVSALVGIIATFFFLIKGIYYFGIGFFYELLGKKQRRTSDAIVFFSEGKNYWNTFRPIIDALAARGESCTYLTSDEQDPGLIYTAHGLVARYIGTGNKAYSTLNMLEADICAMTTPGLDVLQIHRSPGVKHYAHIVHSVTDISFYKLYSFDYYDSIFCSGKHQKRSLRALEELRGTTKKELFTSGCPYMDIMYTRVLSAAMHKTEKHNVIHVLVAPTWGKNGLLTRYGMQLLKPLANSGYFITVRPHPHSHIVEPALLEQLHEELKDTCIVWDENSDGLPAMTAADVLISDLSGIVFDYAFMLERPVLTLEFEPSLEGTDGKDLLYPAWELTVLEQVGKRITLDDVPHLPEIIAEELSHTNFIEKLRKLRDDSVYNFGESGSIIAQQLLNIKQRINNTF